MKYTLSVGYGLVAGILLGLFYTRATLGAYAKRYATRYHLKN